MPKMQQTEELLERHGWTLECWSPLEIHHAESNSKATNMAAKAIIADLMDDENEESASNTVKNIVQKLDDYLGTLKKLHILHPGVIKPIEAIKEEIITKLRF